MGEFLTIRQATKTDAGAISLVLFQNRADRGLYQESAEAVIHTIEDFWVAQNDAGDTVGCAGLHRESPRLAEVYAVAVAPEWQGRGVGRQLLQACIEHARSLGIQQLWLATIKPEYFRRYGFALISRWELPAATLLRKVRQTFQQPPERWLPALFGRYTFMRRTFDASSDRRDAAGLNHSSDFLRNNES